MGAAEQQQKGRTDALAPHLVEMGGHHLHQGDIARKSVLEAGVHLFEGVLDDLENCGGL
jgi:hypothetical protein